MIIYNNIIPVNGFKCFNFFGLIFARKDKKITEKDIRHEKIHTKQIIETLGIGFYLWYAIEWLIKWFGNKLSVKQAYWKVGFEREARGHQADETYLDNRKPYSWLSSVIL